MPRPVPPAPEVALNWSSDVARDFGEAALDLWAEFVERLPSDLPVVRDHELDQVRDAVCIDVPDEAMAWDDIFSHLRTVTLEESVYPGHPSFVAYISGAGTVPGAVADLIASGLNQNVGGWRLSPAATEIERHLAEWFAAKLGLPAGSSGYITTGGANVNLIGLTVARHVKAGWDVRADGLRGGPQLVVYTSSESHDTVDRATQILGLGSRGVRRIRVDDEYRMDVKALVEAIKQDLIRGHRPICVVGTAGTTGTGAIDPLDEIADVCKAHDLWFHVDAAYGGAAAMTDQLGHLFKGIERADTMGFDPHKWLYTPIAGACFLARDPRILREVFAVDASYIIEQGDVDGSGRNVGYMGPGFSRQFGALKIWVSLLAHGWKPYQDRIAHDVALAKYLEELAEYEPQLEVMTPQSLSITTFRFVPLDLAYREEASVYLDELNESILHSLESGGKVLPSNAVVRGSVAIRACVVNFRTEGDTMDLLVAETLRIGRLRDDEMRPESLR
jgi:glutamate/tyrosine decarboxylase-like PLP-dependent enzyme